MVSFRKIAAFWLLSILLVACGGLSSKDRLETIAEIKLPEDFIVLNDNHQKMGADYFVQYDLKFDRDSTQQMIETIRSSKYYSQGHTQLLYDSVWYKDSNLYKFEAHSDAGDKKYEILFDPVTGILNYTEYSQRMKS